MASMDDLLFEELYCLDNETIVTCLKIESVLQTCHNGLEEYTASTAEVLRIWLDGLLSAYISKGENCVEAFRCLHEWFQYHLKSTLEEGDDDAIAILTESLEKLRDFTSWTTEGPIPSERVGHTAAFFILSVVYSWMEERYKYNVEYHESLELVILEIHFTVIPMIRDITSSSRTAHARLLPLLQVLQDISNLLDCNATQTDLLVETNKIITDICVHYLRIEEENQANQGRDQAEHTQDEEEQSREGENGIQRWLEEAIIHLGETALHHASKLHKQFSTTRAEVILQLLSMLQQLFTAGVRKISLKAFDTIHSLLNGKLLESKNRRNIQITQMLGPKLMGFFDQIYKLQSFQEHLEFYMTDPEQVDMAHYEICMGFINVTILDDMAISRSTCRVLEKIFYYLFKEGDHFTIAKYYDRIIEAFATLLYYVDSSKLFRYFLNGLFTGDLIKSQACTDVLLLSFRLRESEGNWSQPDIVEAKSFWIKCNNSYAMFSHNLNQWHVQRMLRYFHKLDVSKELPPFSMTNYRYLHCVSAGTEQEIQFWKLRIQRILRTPLSDKEQYYELVALLHLVSLGEAKWLIQISASVQDILNKDIPNWETLASVFFKLALKVSESSKELILQNSIPAGPLLSGCWYLQKFIYTCRKSDSESVRVLAGECIIANNFDQLLGAAEHEVAPEDKALKSDNLEWQYKTLQLKCQSSECTQKRKRDNGEHKELIDQLKVSSKMLARYRRPFDRADVAQLRRIINDLTEILSSSR